MKKPPAIQVVLGTLVVLIVGYICFRCWDRSRPKESPPVDDPILHIDTMDKGYLNFPVRILARSTGEAMTFDPKQGKPATISYKLTRDGNIRLRVTRRDREDLVLRTLLDWTHQEFGPHEVKWDGRDASGNIVDNRRCFIEFKGDDPKHKKHDPSKCHELSLTILSPAQGGSISKLSDVRLKLKGDRAYGQDDGYELRTYIDYEPASTSSLEKETTEFALPDVENLPPGEHLITVNIEDGHDHIGVAGIRVNVQH